jgi:DNA-directed RNA polymerase subunit H (RpoH/RPB5)
MSNSQVSSSYISSVYKSRKTLLQLMKLQGYNVEDYENFSISEISIMSSNKQLDIFLEKKSSDEFTTSSNKIYICYNYYSQFNTKNINDTVKDLYEGDEPKLGSDDTLLFITKEDPNETIVNNLVHIWEMTHKFVTVISIKRLQFNILEHSLVPPHRVLSKEETASVMKKYNIDELSQFPEISRFDPVASVIGIKPNEICEIKRPSKTSINANYYRICV